MGELLVYWKQTKIDFYNLTTILAGAAQNEQE